MVFVTTKTTTTTTSTTTAGPFFTVCVCARSFCTRCSTRVLNQSINMDSQCVCVCKRENMLLAYARNYPIGGGRNSYTMQNFRWNWCEFTVHMFCWKRISRFLDDVCGRIYLKSSHLKLLNFILYTQYFRTIEGTYNPHVHAPCSWMNGKHTKKNCQWAFHASIFRREKLCSVLLLFLIFLVNLPWPLLGPIQFAIHLCDTLNRFHIVHATANKKINLLDFLLHNFHKETPACVPLNVSKSVNKWNEIWTKANDVENLKWI